MCGFFAIKSLGDPPGRCLRAAVVHDDGMVMCAEHADIVYAMRRGEWR